MKIAAATPVDQATAALHLSQSIQIQTISHQNKAENDWAEWDRLHAWLATTYPAAHAAMTREVIAGHTLVYTWTGSRPELAPIVLMAHQDVVPVTPGSEAAWTHPPFDGVVADGAVWGRGSIDDKGSLVTLFEALESVAAGGFKPVRTVIIVSGHDEEVRGVGGDGRGDHEGRRLRGVEERAVGGRGEGEQLRLVDERELGRLVALARVVAEAVGDGLEHAGPCGCRGGACRWHGELAGGSPGPTVAAGGEGRWPCGPPGRRSDLEHGAGGRSRPVAVRQGLHR